MFNLKENENGFTIIEALVSIAIILLVIIGPLSVAMNSINTVTENKNRVTASYLAEETIENFKNYRDDYALACSNLQMLYDTDLGTLNDMRCGPNNPVPSEYYSSTTPPDTNPQSIAWKMFLRDTMGDININSRNNIYLDMDSFTFNFNSQFHLINDYTQALCDHLSVGDTVGYTCAGSTDSVETKFHRTVALNKISSDTLKIEVNVQYTNSGTFLGVTKSVTIVDYIYKR